MADVLTKEQRSRNMAAIKSKDNKSTELKLVKLFRENRIRGWKRHYKKIEGKPDFVFLKKRIAVFIDGCFWHGCHLHYYTPKTNKKFWLTKIKMNINRDKRVNSLLGKRGWRVVRIWEHQIKKNNSSHIKKIIKLFK